MEMPASTRAVFVRRLMFTGTPGSAITSTFAVSHHLPGLRAVTVVLPGPDLVLHPRSKSSSLQCPFSISVNLFHKSRRTTLCPGPRSFELICEFQKHAFASAPRGKLAADGQPITRPVERNRHRCSPAGVVKRR